MDLIQLILIGLAIILPLIAQSKITSTYNKYSKIISDKNISGREVARKILDSNNLQNVGISVAVNNAYAEVKKVAKYTTNAPVEKGAFAEAIYKFI